MNTCGGTVNTSGWSAMSLHEDRTLKQDQIKNWFKDCISDENKSNNQM